jgi:hypothetical protein
MKHGSLLFLCLIFSFLLVAQSKKEQKLLDLYSSKNYEKLTKKAQKLLSKDRNNIYANYCISAMYLEKSKSKKSQTSKKSYVAKAIRYYSKISKNDFMEYHEQIHEVVRKNALDSNQKGSINSQYRNWLLVYFGETIRPFHIKTNIVKSIPIDRLKIADSLRYAMLIIAQKLEGVPYKYAGTTPKLGFDCSGFTQYIYQSVGIEIPHNAHMQSTLSSKQEPLNALKPGDLVFFGGWHGDQHRTVHAGIIFEKEGDNFTVIHCVNGGVKIEGANSSWDRYWKDKVLFGISADTLAHR